MPDIGYVTLPVIPAFRGITGQVQDQLNKAFKTTGTDLGKIMGQSAGASFAKDPSLEKAMGAAPTSMTVLTSATDKQTDAVIKLQGAHKQLASAMGSADDRTRVIAVQDKQTDALRRTETQVKQAKTAHDQLAQSVKKVNDEQKRSQDLTFKNLKSDVGKAITGDTRGAVDDLGKQLGTKIGGTLRDTVKDVTGMSVDAMADKVKGAAAGLGVDLGSALDKALKGDRTGALHDVGQQLGAKAGSAITGQVKGLTGIDLGGTGFGDFLAANAPGAAGAAVDWLTGGGPGETLNWLKGGGLGQTLGALKQPGGVRGALGSIDPKSLLGGINNVTGGGVQPILDAHGQAMDVMEGLLGGTAAEKFLPAFADAALPIVAGGFFGQKLGRGLQGLDSDRISAGYDDTGTATNPIERAVESIPVVGNFLGPPQETREANMRRRDAMVGSTASFYKSIFGDDQTGTGQGITTGGGGGGPVSTEDMQVDAGVATISAGSVSLGGTINLPAGLTAGGGGSSTGRTMSDSGGASSLYTGGSGVRTGSSSSSGTGSLYGGDDSSPYFATGGPIGTDTALFWGTPGEWVIQKPAVDKYGPSMMSAINAGYFAGGGPIGGTRGDGHPGPRGSASDPIYTMPSPGYTQAIGQQAPPRTGGGGTGGGSAGLLGSDAFNAAGGISGLMGIGQQAASDMIPGFGNIASDPLVQAGMNMMQAALGMATQPGGLKGALTSDEAGKRTFGGMFGDGAGGAGSPFGMIPQVAGMPHPDDMVASPSDAAFGGALSNRIGGGEATHVDQSTTLNVTGFSAQEVGNQVYRALGQTGVPNNTPRMNTNMPHGA